jgi:hypothetical protein
MKPAYRSALPTASAHSAFPAVNPLSPGKIPHDEVHRFHIFCRDLSIFQDFHSIQSPHCR